MNLKPKYNFKKAKISDCCLTDLNKIQSRVGNITVLENHKTIPFDIKRVYYLYDVPAGEDRGGHAHYELQQYLIAAGGSFDVEIFDGTEKKIITLNRPYQALHILPGVWRELKNFSSGGVCLVMASEKYIEEDYIRDLAQFISIKKK